MVKDRLIDLIGTQSCKVNGEVRIQIEKESVSNHSKNLKEIYERTEVINQWLETIEENNRILKQDLKKLQNVQINQRELDGKIEDRFNNSTTICHQIQNKLKIMDEELNSDKSSLICNSTEYRIKSIQYNTLKTRYKIAFDVNLETLENFKRIKKSQLKAQIRAKGISVTEEELLRLMDDGTDVEVFTENILSETVAAKQQLEDINERHQQLIKIEQMLQDIRDMFMQLAILVDYQKDLIDRIEYQADITQEYVTNGREEVVEARKHQKSAKKKKIILGAILIVIVIIVIVLLLV